MKLYLLLFAICLATSPALHAQHKNTTPIYYGASFDTANAVSAATLTSDAAEPASANAGNLRGRVAEVCQEKGCWMKLETANGEKLMVRFKNYGFFVPKDLKGKEVIIHGTSMMKEVSVAQQKHYAEDAGLSKQEIEKIQVPKKERHFIAVGVFVL
jgi:hypothetical protein